MKKFGVSLLLLAGCLLFTASTALALTNNCPVTTGLIDRQFTGGPVYDNVVVPGASTTNNLATLGSAGCTAIDLTFSNFALTSTGTNESTPPSLAGTYLSVSPTSTTQTNPDTLLFSTLQGDGTGADGAENDGVDNTKLDESDAFTSTMSYGVADTSPAGIVSALLTVNDITISTGGSGSVTIDTCSKGSTVITGAITTSGACTAAAAGAVFQSTTITLAQLASQNAVLDFAAHPGFVDVTQVISLTCATCGTDETGFLTFSDEFLEAPEPSTFGLFGAALASIGLLRLRKRS